MTGELHGITFNPLSPIFRVKTFSVMENVRFIYKEEVSHPAHLFILSQKQLESS